MIIRSYTDQDYGQVLLLYKNKATYGGNFDVGRDERQKLLRTAQSDNLFVATVNDVVVGTCMTLTNPHSFWLLRFAVDPKQVDAQEIAEKLLAYVSSLAREQGHDSVIIYTDNTDQTLMNRYDRLGCHEAGTYKCYWKETNDEV